jgi:hypothetical protein
MSRRRFSNMSPRRLAFLCTGSEAALLATGIDDLEPVEPLATGLYFWAAWATGDAISPKGEFSVFAVAEGAQLFCLVSRQRLCRRY